MAKKKYRALNVIDYISTRTGEDAHVEPGDIFDDMNSVGVRNETAHGNIEAAPDSEEVTNK